MSPLFVAALWRGGRFGADVGLWGLWGDLAPQAGIWIDVCAAHGTWFDRFELGIVMEALRPRNEFKPVSYNGPTPDFREGANTELQGFGKIVGMGVLGLLGGAAALGKVGGAR